MALRKYRRGKKGIWNVRGHVRGRYFEKSTRTVDAKKAEALRARWEAEVWQDRPDPTDSLVTYEEAWSVFGAQRDFSDGDLRDYKHLLNHFEGVRLTGIDQAALDRYIAQEFSSCAPGTIIRHAIAPLSSLIRFSARRDWCPAVTFERPKRPPGRVRWITKEESETLINVAAGHLAPLIEFMLYTGARIGEALYLDWREVNLEARRIYLLDTKNGESRGVPLHPRAFIALANLDGRTGKVFRRPGGAEYALKHEGGGQIHKGFKGACDRAGIIDFTPHDCRHTFASWAVMSGVDLRALADLLGHKSLNMVMRYAHLSPEHLRDSVDRIEAKSGQNRGKLEQAVDIN